MWARARWDTPFGLQNSCARCFTPAFAPLGISLAGTPPAVWKHTWKWPTYLGTKCRVDDGRCELLRGAFRDPRRGSEVCCRGQYPAVHQEQGREETRARGHTRAKGSGEARPELEAGLVLKVVGWGGKVGGGLGRRRGGIILLLAQCSRQPDSGTTAEFTRPEMKQSLSRNVGALTWDTGSSEP